MWDYYYSELGTAFYLDKNMNQLGCILMMAFFFGPGIPIMFPLATILIILNEIFMRYQLAYQFSKPFNYSNELNSIFIKFCDTLPMMYSLIGFWMYSNRQIYENKVVPKASLNGTVDHRHTIVYSLTNITPGTPFLYLLVVSMANYIIKFFDIKYSKICSCFDIVRRINSRVTNLRVVDNKNFYWYQKHDLQFKYFEHLQAMMKEIFKSTGVSPYEEFIGQFEIVKKQSKQKSQLSESVIEELGNINRANSLDLEISLIGSSVDQ